MSKKNISKVKTNFIVVVCISILVLGGYLIFHNLSLNNNIIKNIESSNITSPKKDDSEISEEKINVNNYKKKEFSESTLVNDNEGVPVLYYHSVRQSAYNEVTITPQLLRSELQYLKDTGYITLTMGELNDYILNNSPIPKKSIVITFDDGYMDNYTNVFPILKELGIKATIFCITMQLDGSYYLSRNAIKEMSDFGIDIESHTVNHPKLNTMSYDKQLTELKESKLLLESITGKVVTSVAYPFGDFNDNTIKAAQEAGYSLGFTTNRGFSDRCDNPMKLDRIYVSSNYNLETFKQILSNTKK